MTTQDYIVASLFIAFGLWFIFFPVSVINFYSILNSELKAKPFAIRLVGLGWVAVVIAVCIATFQK